MRDEIIEEFYDVLQNIEYAIMNVYENDGTLLDLDVLDALDGLIRSYGAEEQNRTPPGLRLSKRANHLFGTARRMCEWRLGRGLLNEDDAADTALPPEEHNTVAEILICLKRIRKSVRLWNEEGGRQGYLDYIASFFRKVGGGA